MLTLEGTMIAKTKGDLTFTSLKLFANLGLQPLNQ